MRTGLVFCAGWLLGANAIYAQGVCAGLKRLPDPVALAHNDVSKGHCVQVDAQRKLCKHQTDGDLGAAFFIETPQASQNLFEAIAFFEDTSDFAVFRADLDHDGRPEWIIANRNGVGNGLAPQSWTITILSALRPDARGLQYRVHDFGESHFAPAATGHHGCRLLATEWVEHAPVNQRQGRYFLGRWFTYRHGHLVADSSQPVRVRRLHVAFEKEVLAPAKRGYEGQPQHWLRPEKSTALVDEADFLAVGALQVLSNENAVPAALQEVSLPSRPAGPMFDPASPLDTWVHGASPASKGQFIRLGDADTRRLFPPDYRLAHGQTLLRDGRLGLSNYGPDSSVVWIHPAAP